MKKTSNYNLIVILGPTASGKTALAARLAYDFGLEIISADSRQVYRGMDVGTGKDIDEFTVEGKNIPHHMIDIINPSEEFSLYDFHALFFKTFDEISSRGVKPLLVGGTGLYIDSILSEYSMLHVPENEELRKKLEGEDIDAIVKQLKSLKPELHNTTDLLDKDRAVRALEIAIYEKEHDVSGEEHPDIIPLVFGTRWERQTLRERITKRLKERLDNGLIEEVERLHDEGTTWEKLDFFGLEYRYVGQYLQKELNRNDMFQKLNAAIHKFAKKQETWFRRMEKNGINIRWIDDADYEQLKMIVETEHII